MSIKDKLNKSILDIDLGIDTIYPKEKIKSLDTKSRYKRFRFFYNGLILPLDNITIRAYIIKPDKKIIFNDLIKIDNNIVELEFTNQALLNPGILQLELVLYEDDAELSSFLLEFEVIKSIRNSDAIESSNEFTSLQIALREVEQIKNSFQSLYNDKESMLNNLFTTQESKLNNLKSTKETELNNLKLDKSDELDNLKRLKENELNTLKINKETELSNLKTEKEKDFNDTNNTWNDKFEEKYDNLNSEYAHDLNNLKEHLEEYKVSKFSECMSIPTSPFNQFKVGKGKVKYTFETKDYSETVYPTLIQFDAINGRSGKSTTYKSIKNLDLSTIGTLVTLDENSINLAYEDNIQIKSYSYGARPKTAPISALEAFKSIDKNKLHRASSKLLVEVEGGQTYYVKNFGFTQVQIILQQYDETFCKSKDNDDSDDGIGWGTISNKRKVTVELDTKYINIYMKKTDDTEFTRDDLENIKLMMVKSSSEPIEFKNYKKKVLDFCGSEIKLASGIGSTENIKDFYKDGILYKKFEQIRLTSDMDISIQKESSHTTTTLFRFFKFAQTHGISLPSSDFIDFRCDKYSSKVIFSTNEEGVYMSAGGHLYLSVSNSFATTVDELKKKIETYADSIFVEMPLAETKKIKVPLTVYATSGSQIQVQSSYNLGVDSSGPAYYRVALNEGAHIENLSKSISNIGCSISDIFTLIKESEKTNQVQLFQKEILELKSYNNALRYGLQAILRGDMQELAYSLYPEDFK